MALCALANQGPLTRGADRLVDAGDEAVGHGEAGQHGEVALGDGEGHVGARGVAPFGDDAAASSGSRRPGRRAAPRGRRSRSRAPSRSIRRCRRSARPDSRSCAAMGCRWPGEVDGGLQLARIEAGFRRGDARPSRPIGDIGIAGVRSGGHLAFPGAFSRRNAGLARPARLAQAVQNMRMIGGGSKRRTASGILIVSWRGQRNYGLGFGETCRADQERQSSIHRLAYGPDIRE